MGLQNSAPSVTPRQRVLKPEQIQAIFEVFQGIEPEPKGELDYVNAYTLVVAVALSAQATDMSPSMPRPKPCLPR